MYQVRILVNQIVYNYAENVSALMSISITDTYCEFEREPLANPFGFKGGYLKEIWQTAVLLKSDDQLSGIGLGCQSVLWSDRRIFVSASESGGNSLMFAITDKALQLAKGRSFDTPIDLLNQLFPEVYAYAQGITGLPDLNMTFVMNALVAIDNAAWILYAKHHGIKNFDELIPEKYRPALSYRHDQVACVPIASYGMSIHDIKQLVNRQGYFVLKIKIGSPGGQQEMLENDKKRFEQIHQAIGETKSQYTKNGLIPYYLDINGRYESKELLKQFLDHAEKIGAMNQIFLLEEPFPEEYTAHVDDLGITIVADESAHTADNVKERIEMGYGAMALKPIVKTLSMTFEMAKIAYEYNTPCFCADLTVNPVLVDWNKNVAARLTTIPGINTGLLETNGHQNYKYWKEMLDYHPDPDASWVQSRNGVFNLDKSFYKKSGGIFEDLPHYRSILMPQ